MELFTVPDIFSDTPLLIAEAPEVNIIAYHQDQQIEQANVELTKNLIIFVLKGYKEVIGEESKVRIEEGEGYFLRRGKYLLSEKFKESNQYESLLFFFSDQLAHQFSTQALDLRESSKEAIEDGRTFKLNEKLRAYIQNLRAYAQADDLLNTNAFTELKMMELFWLLVKTLQGAPFEQFLSRLSKQPTYQIQKVMEAHYRENVSLEQLAFLTGNSLSTFKRRFKEEYQTTPGEWIRQKRLQEAQYLLRSTRKNVTQVCYEVGFENVSHFVQSFKEKFGTTPKQFQLEQLST
ncbi:MAG: helix-turn-helix domain-containing protein [Bacteroidota bacterium]